jgi:hypothetical protein
MLNESNETDRAIVVTASWADIPNSTAACDLSVWRTADF